MCPVDGLGVGVEQQLVRVAAQPGAGVVRAVHPVAVALAGPDPGQVAVPDQPVALGQRDPLLDPGRRRAGTARSARPPRRRSRSWCRRRRTWRRAGRARRARCPPHPPPRLATTWLVSYLGGRPITTVRPGDPVAPSDTPEVPVRTPAAGETGRSRRLCHRRRGVDQRRVRRGLGRAARHLAGLRVPRPGPGRRWPSRDARGRRLWAADEVRALPAARRRARPGPAPPRRRRSCWRACRRWPPGWRSCGPSSGSCWSPASGRAWRSWPWPAPWASPGRPPTPGSSDR